MYRRMIYVVSLLAVLSITGRVSADLVAHWPLDDGSGTVAADVTGNGSDGTLNGDPQWVAGKIGGALEFDGDDYVDCGNQDILNFGTNDWTITAWIRTTQPDPDRGTIFANGSDNSGGIRFTLATHEANPNHITLTTDDNSTKTQALGATVVNDGEWYHIAGMRQGTTISVYVNGVLDGTNTVPAGIDFSGSSQAHAYLGAIDGNSDPATVALEKIYVGIIDDVRVYNSALTEAELQASMEGGEGFPYALGPDPADGALHEDTWITLSWSAGDFAVSHDVYLGEDYDEVSIATTDSDVFRGNQTTTFYVAGFPGYAYPDGLIPGTTYYWRIDEVNDADPNSPWKGPIWSFSIPPKTAYNPVPTDNAEAVGPDDVTLSWTAGFGAKLHTIYIGNDYDEVSNATGGMMQGAATYNAGSLDAEIDKFSLTIGINHLFKSAATIGNERVGHFCVLSGQTTQVDLVNGEQLAERKFIHWQVKNGTGNHGMRCYNRYPVDGIDDPVTQISDQSILLFGFHIHQRAIIIALQLVQRYGFVELNVYFPITFF